MDVTHLTDKNYLDFIRNLEGGIILFHKQLCPHCLNMQKVLAKLSAKRGDIGMILIDSEENPQSMASLEVERVPTLIVIKHGEAVGEKIGVYPDL